MCTEEGREDNVSSTVDLTRAVVLPASSELRLLDVASSAPSARHASVYLRPDRQVSFRCLSTIDDRLSYHAARGEKTSSDARAVPSTPTSEQMRRARKQKTETEKVS